MANYEIRITVQALRPDKKFAPYLFEAHRSWDGDPAKWPNLVHVLRDDLTEKILVRGFFGPKQNVSSRRVDMSQHKWLATFMVHQPNVTQPTLRHWLADTRIIDLALVGSTKLRIADWLNPIAQAPWKV